MLDNIKAKVNQVINDVNLKIATNDSTVKSEAIKSRVREKITKLSEENKQNKGYDSLLSIHAEIEANHDKIYRPDKNISVSQAEEASSKLLFKQEELENKFNIAYAEITGSPAVEAENAALQAERKERDTENSIEQIKTDAIKKANDVAEKAKEHAGNVQDDLQEAAAQAKEDAGEVHDNLADKAEEFGKRVGNAVEDVKEEFTRSKPRI